MVAILTVMKRRIIFLLGSCFFVAALFLLIPTAEAQDENLGIALSIPLEGEVANGSIVCKTADSYELCSRPYDPHIYGVVVLSPAISIVRQEGESLWPVVTSGIAMVRVSNVGGDIQKGDYITASDIPGVGQKADRSGYVLGWAAEGNTNVGGEAMLTVAVGARPAIISAGAGDNLLVLLREGIDASFLSPLTTFRYILAAIIAALSFGIGFWQFGRMAKTGVEALGRNPLAGKMVQASVIANVILTIIFMAGGLLLAYILLTI